MLRMLFLSLFACNDYMVHKQVEEEGAPEIVVVPEQIDFGHLRAGQETGQSAITIINAGDIDLYVSGVEIQDTSGFSVEQMAVKTILPGESVTLDVVYTPVTYEEKMTSIVIESDDADEDRITIPIVGFGDAPVITATPIETEFTNVEVGCVEEVEIEISNVGNIDLEISSFSHLASTPVDTELKNQNPLPLVIAEGGSAVVTVEYEPDDLLDDESQVIVYSNDPVSPEFEVFQEGNGIIAETVTETFIQEGTGKSDIIFVVDNSGSMYPFQQEVANNISVFMNVFVTLNIDYKIGVITTDSPDFLGAIIDPTMADPAAELANQIGMVAGVYGSGMERGIQMVYESTQPGGDAGPGGSFLRDDALFVVVFISDEPDWSSITWTDLANYLNVLKGDPTKVIAHSVIGDYPSGCTWTSPQNPNYTRPIQYGAGYYDITKYYNGIAFSICSTSWGVQMQSMAQNSVLSANYELSEDGIIEDSIEITIDGTTSTEWYYDETNNSVAFHQSYIPDEGQEVEITYSLYGCLEEEQDTASN